MTNTKDQMQDVFPIEFNFVNGEQPDANKFTGWRKQTDAAFNRIVSAIGDPWEYNVHANNLFLSPERLLQASLARVIGPSSYLSPQGSSWNEGQSIGGNITVTLNKERNFWDVGFPLVKKVSSNTNVTSDSSMVASVYKPVEGITFTPSGGTFQTLKTSAANLVAVGDYYIDYYGGTIVSFSQSTVGITMNIPASEAMVMIGPGVPWGTHNVIPDWNDSSPGCNVEKDGSSSTRWKVGLGTISLNTSNVLGTEPYEATTVPTWSVKIPGQGAKYRLPESIRTLSAGDQIPEGFMYIWDDGTKRILPLLSFEYLNEHEVIVIGPERALSPGSPSQYRLVLTGTSTAEVIKYLLTTIRYNRHTGLSTLNDRTTGSFSPPINHDNLTNLYAGIIPAGNPYTKYRFVESKMPINPHPQYLHRAGYNSIDTANSCNAMRGDLVFTGTALNETSFPIGVPVNKESYGIKFGTGANYLYLRFTGGTLAQDSAVPIPFGISGVGINRDSSGTDYYGALAFKTAYNLPFYLQCSGTDNYDSGPSIAFDYDSNSEMNYIKLLPANRTGSNDPINLPARTGQSGWAQPLEITKDLTNRLSPEQIREWRFRGVSYLAGAQNTGLGVSSRQKYFTSPGVVGADWFNVYSNAIFFSETGNGKATSLHSRIESWLNSGGSRPVGIYYEPQSGGAFSLYGTSELLNRTLELARFGNAFSKIVAYREEDDHSGSEEYSYIQLAARDSEPRGIKLNSKKPITIESDDYVSIRSKENISIGGEYDGSTTKRIGFATGMDIPDETSGIQLYSKTNGINLKTYSTGFGLNGYFYPTGGENSYPQGRILHTNSSLSYKIYHSSTTASGLSLGSSSNLELKHQTHDINIEAVNTKLFLKGKEEVKMYLDDTTFLRMHTENNGIIALKARNNLLVHADSNDQGGGRLYLKGNGITLTARGSDDEDAILLDTNVGGEMDNLSGKYLLVWDIDTQVLRPCLYVPYEEEPPE